MTPEARSSRRRRDGPAFTLIEVVVALAIFAMAATVLTSSFVNILMSMDRDSGSGGLERDIRMARRQLLLEPDIEDAREGGEIETLGNGTARWHAEIEPTDVVDLFRVRLTVEVAGQDASSYRAQTERESTLRLLRPTWSESDERSELLQEKKEALRDSRERRF